MPRLAAIVPDEQSQLCEGCGYILDGLPADGLCPECGKPLAASAGNDRTPTAWEIRPGIASFCRTSIDVILHTHRFYRTLQTRGNPRTAARFADIHWLIAAVLLSTAAYEHWLWTHGQTLTLAWTPTKLIWLGVAIGAYFFLRFLTDIAARLSAWEASLRGLRMPRRVVLRALHYHAPHTQLVAVVALITVTAFVYIEPHLSRPDIAATAYMYTLCAEVVLGAVYLFLTYWSGMRGIMYANR